MEEFDVLNSFVEDGSCISLKKKKEQKGIEVSYNYILFNRVKFVFLSQCNVLVLGKAEEIEQKTPNLHHLSERRNQLLESCNPVP